MTARKQRLGLAKGLVLLLALLYTACLPTTSNNFESARMLPYKAVEVQGCGSLYYGELDKYDSPSWELRTLNLGLTAAYGINTRLRARARFDQIHLKDRAELPNGAILPIGSQIRYSEISLKYGWVQRKSKTFAAVSMPISLTTYKDGDFWTLSPTVFATYYKNDQFEIGINGKLHIWFQGAPHYPWFSFGIGCGISKNLNRWAIRPEIGYDIFNISAGLGFSYIFSPHQAKQ